MNCPFCGKPLTPGGTAIVCGSKLQGGVIRLPDWCSDLECARERDRKAIERAIKAGVIDP